MEQIATGGDEAAGASQEQLAAIKNITVNLATARDHAEVCRRRTEVVQSLLIDTSTQITASVRVIERNAARQEADCRWRVSGAGHCSPALSQNRT